MAGPNPVLVEVSRGDMVESHHRGAAAVVSADGRLAAAWGDVERPVYARSAIKPLQALPLIETGAAEHFRLGDAEIALACASHGGEAAHIERVAAWLERIGLDVEHLECGPHLPFDESAAATLLRSGRRASALHNNCSGKHAGFLTTAVHLGEQNRGYIRPEHPVQRRLRQLLEELSGVDLAHAPTGVDGCGMPVIAMSLRATATAMARLAAPDVLSAARAAAARRIVAAMTAAPFMVAGSGHFCTRVMAQAGAAVVVKTGAEGVFTAALPRQGVGVALKIEDGAGRAATVAIGAILRHLGALTETDCRALSEVLEPPVLNRAGEPVGRMRAAATWLD